MFHIDCLTKCCTIASFCFRVFKTHYMKANTVAHIGRDGHRSYSYEGIRWIAFMEKNTGQNITHARNGNECVFKLMNKCVYPDGYAEILAKEYKAVKENFIYERQLFVYDGLKDRNEQKWTDMTARRSVNIKRIVYLFHGCIWHGHQECDNGKLEHRGVSSLDRSRMTKLQEAAYKKAGFEVVTVRECE